MKTVTSIFNWIQKRKELRRKLRSGELEKCFECTSMGKFTVGYMDDMICPRCAGLKYIIPENNPKYRKYPYWWERVQTTV